MTGLLHRMLASNRVHVSHQSAENRLSRNLSAALCFFTVGRGPVPRHSHPRPIVGRGPVPRRAFCVSFHRRARETCPSPCPLRIFFTVGRGPVPRHLLNTKDAPPKIVDTMVTRWFCRPDDRRVFLFSRHLNTDCEPLARSDSIHHFSTAPFQRHRLVRAAHRPHFRTLQLHHLLPRSTRRCGCRDALFFALHPRHRYQTLHRLSHLHACNYADVPLSGF